MPNVPNQYHLQGEDISVSYYPEGFGPPLVGRGSLIFTYQDAHRSESFFSEDADVRTVNVDDIGLVVSVTIVQSVDTGSTTFSLLIPSIELPDGQSSVFIRTEGITTVHRVFVGLIGHPQAETYRVTKLDGSATFGALPLVAQAS